MDADEGPRVLMIGWEFPPLVSGGLGVACAGLVRGLTALGCRITLLVPGQGGEGRHPVAPAPDVEGLRILRVPMGLQPYPSSDGLYGPDLMRNVDRLAERSVSLAGDDAFDVIHAHDWMTYPAAAALRLRSRRPSIAHVHATEFARSGPRADPAIEGIERRGILGADRVICVSRRTSEVVRRRYGISPTRLRVVHNAVDAGDDQADIGFPNDRPLVLYVGRLTRQKAPAVFLEAARAVLELRPDVEFVLAGTGDRMEWLRARMLELGIADRVSLPGFLPPERLEDLYRRASVYAMPSIDEPFGLTVLEAARHHVPAIVSSGAGAIEVVPSVLRVEPGDAEALARRIVFLLDSPVSGWLLARHAAEEVAQRSWRRAAAECMAVYSEVS